MNQLRHVKFFGTFKNMQEHMKKHMSIIAPKFSLVCDKLEKELAPLGIGQWTTPKGGYFISFNAPNGCAKRIVSLCSEAGVTLTGAGATFPYGIDPDDKNIRLAPTYPPIEDLSKAMDLFVICVKIAAAEKLSCLAISKNVFNCVIVMFFSFYIKQMFIDAKNTIHFF